MANRYEEALARAAAAQQQAGPQQSPQPANRYQAALQRVQASPAAAAPQTRGSILDPLMQGVTLGFGDEMAAGLSAAGALFTDEAAGDAYDRTLNQKREQLDAYRERRPGVSMGAEIAGAVPSALIPGTAALRGASLGAKMGRGAAAGAAFGGVQGFGSGEGGALPRGVSAVSGAALGSAVGGALPAAGAGVGAGYRAARDAIRPNELAGMGVGRRAQSELFRVLDKDNMTAGDVMQRARDYGPDAMPADTSEALRNKADVLVHFDRPGARENLREPLRQRSEGRRDAAGGLFDDVLGTKPTYGPSPSVPETARIYSGARRKAADQAYEAARQANAGRPVDTGPLVQRLAGDVQSGTALLPREKAAQQFSRYLTTGDGALVDDFGRLSEIQAEIAKDVRSFSTSADGGQRRVGEILGTYHDDLVRALDSASDGLYSEARGQYRTDSSVMDAFERGRKALGTGEHPDDLAEFTAKQSPEGRAALRLGARGNARGIMSSSRGDLTAVQQLAAPGTRIRENLASIVGQDDAGRIGQRAKGEIEKRATERVGAGSQTARRMQDPDSGEGIKVPLGADVFGTAARGAQKLAEALMPDLNAGRARGLSQFLGSQGANRDELIKALMREGTRRDARISPRTRLLIDALLSQQAPAAIAGSGTPQNALGFR